MKTFMTIVALVLAAYTSQAQNYEYREASGGGTKTDYSTYDQTGSTVDVDGTVYDLRTTGSGSDFILCVSPKTGNAYPVWVGTPNGQTFDGRPVRMSKSGTPFVLIISSNTGNPYCKYLTAS